MQDKIIYVPVSVEDELPNGGGCVIDCGDGYFDALFDSIDSVFYTFHRNKVVTQKPATWLKPVSLYSLLQSAFSQIAHIELTQESFDWWAKQKFL